MEEQTNLDADAIKRLTLNSDPWLSCDDCFDQADVMVEGLIAENIPLTQEFGVHLSACPACHEEATALAELVAGDFNLRVEDVISRLEAAVATSKTSLAHLPFG